MHRKSENNNPSILIIDDEPEVLSTMKDAIEKMSVYNVSLASSLNTAISKIGEMGFDLIILDFTIGDTLSFVREIRKGKIGNQIGDEKLKDVPIMICSATSKKEIDHSLGNYELKFQNDLLYLMKPFLLKDFIDTIDKILKMDRN